MQRDTRAGVVGGGSGVGGVEASREVPRGEAIDELRIV